MNDNTKQFRFRDLPLHEQAAVIVSWIVVGCFAYTFVCGVKEAIFG